MGEYCQHLNPCHKGPRCQNGGSCRVREGIDGGTPSFVCSCPVGFSASLCEIPLENACDSLPCFNGATCVLKSLWDYSCTCASGYTGESKEKQQKLKKFIRIIHRPMLKSFCSTKTNFSYSFFLFTAQCNNTTDFFSSRVSSRGTEA